MENWSSDDLLSELPLSIIHAILELTPIRDAVRTSLLSRNWRYKWATLPRLAFKNECLSSSREDEWDWSETRVKRFITHALFLHKGPILECKLDATSINSCPDTDLWLLCLSRNGIRELYLYNYCIDPFGDIWLESFRVHSSVYDCQKLTHLELRKCELPSPPPSFNGFPCLRNLSLTYCPIPSNAIESILDKSPLLEKLILIRHHCDGDTKLRIRAPNLKMLHLQIDYKKICLYAPLLIEMTIVGVNDNCQTFTIDSLQEESRMCNYTKFHDGFMNLQVLAISSFFIKYFGIGIESFQQSSLAFHHLKTIDIQLESLEDIRDRSVVYRLVMDAPNLDSLCLYSCHSNSTQDDESEAPQVLDLGWTSNFTFKKLTDVNITRVLGLPGEMEFIKFLVKSSPMLERMTIFYPSNVPAEPLQKICPSFTRLCPTFI